MVRLGVQGLPIVSILIPFWGLGLFGFRSLGFRITYSLH